MVSDEWYMIVNPYAGSGKTLERWEQARSQLERSGVPFRYEFTEGEGTLPVKVCRACAAGYRHIAAVGGDGTVHETLSGIMAFLSTEEGSAYSPSDFTLAVIPIGSGNDWIRTTGVPRDPAAAAALLADHVTISQDVVRVTDASGKARYMVNVGGVGLDARVCAKVNRYKALGHRNPFLYVTALAASVGRHRCVDMEVRCDGETVYAGPVYTIAVANGRYSGGGMRQTSPLTAPDDGLLDVSVIPRINVFQFLAKVPTILTGTLYRRKPVMAFRCRRLEVLPSGQRGSVYEVDGEVPGTIPVTMETSGDRINVVVPR